MGICFQVKEREVWFLSESRAVFLSTKRSRWAQVSLSAGGAGHKVFGDPGI